MQRGEWVSAMSVFKNAARKKPSGAQESLVCAAEPVPMYTSESLETLCRGVTALVAEDNEFLRSNIISYLNRKGVTAYPACNGREAADIFYGDPEKYEMIFMDIQMPVLNGIAAAKEIRAAGGPGAAVPIAAMTGGSFIKESCFDYFLEKPFEMEKLMQAIACMKSKPRQK